MGGLFISASGILAATQRNDITANNVANVRTPGYRSVRGELTDTNSGGVRVGETSRDTRQGPLQGTGRSLDVAVTNDAFFQVETADGSLAYTRSGSFGIDSAGQLVTSEGLPLEPPITVPANATSVSVGEDGSVYASVPGSLAPQSVGQLEVFTFANPGGLQALGDGLYGQTLASGAPTEAAPQFAPGFLEQSNVDLVEQTVNQISDTNLLKANANAFRAQSDLLGEVLRITD